MLSYPKSDTLIKESPGGVVQKLQECSQRLTGCAESHGHTNCWSREGIPWTFSGAFRLLAVHASAAALLKLKEKSDDGAEPVA